MSKTNFLENALLNFVLRNVSYTPPSTVYVALFTTNPGETGTGTEVSTSGTGYARQSVAFTNATTGSTSNSAQINFPTASSGWGTVTHFGIMDASSGGNMLYYGALTNARTVLVGDQVKFPINQLIVTED